MQSPSSHATLELLGQGATNSVKRLVGTIVVDKTVGPCCSPTSYERSLRVRSPSLELGGWSIFYHPAKSEWRIYKSVPLTCILYGGHTVIETIKLVTCCFIES